MEVTQHSPSLSPKAYLAKFKAIEQKTEALNDTQQDEFRPGGPHKCPNPEERVLLLDYPEDLSSSSLVSRDRDEEGYYYRESTVKQNEDGRQSESLVMRKMEQDGQEVYLFMEERTQQVGKENLPDSYSAMVVTPEGTGLSLAPNPTTLALCYHDNSMDPLFHQLGILS